MGLVRFSKRAREDLLDIWLYVATHASHSIADQIYDSVEQACARLGKHPHLGRVRPEIHSKARSITIERWLALYRVTHEGVQIVRVIDGARDLSKVEWTAD